MNGTVDALLFLVSIDGVQHVSESIKSGVLFAYDSAQIYESTVDTAEMRIDFSWVMQNAYNDFIATLSVECAINAFDNGSAERISFL